MTATGRFIAPSSSRVAAAIREGHLPISSAFTFGTALLVTSIALYGMKSSLYNALTRSVRWGAAGAISKPSLDIFLVTDYLQILWPVGLVLAAPFLGALLGRIVPVFLFSRGRGRTAVPIPHVAYPRVEIGAFRLIGAMVTGGFVWYQFVYVDWGAAGVERVALLFDMTLHCALFLGAVSLATGLHEMFARRRALFEALRLSRSEFARELRHTQGAHTKKRRPEADRGSV